MTKRTRKVFSKLPFQWSFPAIPVVRRERKRRGVTPAVSIESMECRQLLAAFTWQGGFDGHQWHSARNWFNVDLGQTNQGFPGAADTATITSGPTVFLNSDVSIGHLHFAPTVAQQTIHGPASTLTVNSARIEGGVLTTRVVNTGTMIFNVPSTAVDISTGTGAPLINGGLQNDGVIDHQNGVVVVNSPVINPVGSEIRLADGVKLVRNSNDRIQNSGTLRKTAGPGTTLVSVSLTNSPVGRIEVDGGILEFAGYEYAMAGTLEIAPGATFESNVVGGAGLDEMTIADVVSLTGGGAWRHRRGSMIFNGGRIDSSDTAFLVQADNSSSAGAALVRGTGTFNVANMRVVKGQLGIAGFGGSPAAHVFTNNGTITFAGQANSESQLANATLINNQSVQFSGSPTSFDLVGAMLDNRQSGVVMFQRDATVNSAFGNGVGPSFLRNAGTLIVGSSVNAVSLPGALFQNVGGTLDVRAGTLDLSTIRNWNSAAQSFRNPGWNAIRLEMWSGLFRLEVSPRH